MRLIRDLQEKFGGNQSYKWGIPLSISIVLAIIVGGIYFLVHLFH